MKHLLIITFILFLFTSHLFGQFKETIFLYLWDTSSGLQWKTFGDGDVQPIYKGEIKNGKPNGLGVLSYPFMDGKSVIGEWIDGEQWNTKHYNVEGTTTVKVVKGVKQGMVLFFRKENGEWGWFGGGDEKMDEKYVGEIENGKPNGQGTLIFPKGDKYVGEWKDGTWNGQGTYTWSNGSKYVGEWKDGTFHGRGTVTSPYGYRHVVEFKDRKKHSQGTFTWSKVGKYEGEWKDGEKHGQGTFTFPDGRKYVGEWKNGEKHGQGTLTSPDGDKYVGEWKEGEINGQGTLAYSNGRKYEGEWIEDKRHGQGTFTFPDGEKVIGKFRNGRLWNITEYDKNGIIMGKFVNGVFKEE